MTDRRLASGVGGGERGEAWLGVGSAEAGRRWERGGRGGRLAWVRCGFEFYLLLPWVPCPLSVSSLYSFFLPFLSCAHSLYSDFRVYLSGFA